MMLLDRKKEVSSHLKCKNFEAISPKTSIFFFFIFGPHPNSNFNVTRLVGNTLADRRARETPEDSGTGTPLKGGPFCRRSS